MKRILSAGLFAAFLFYNAPGAEAVVLAELPRVRVDTSIPVQTGSVVQVAHNCSGIANCSTDLQAAINSANPGDTIMLKAGEVFAGTFTLPNKSNPQNKWIVIESSDIAQLPEGKRVALSDAVHMPTITAGTSMPHIAILTQSKANYYRFNGIRFVPTDGMFATALIRIGDSNVPETKVSDLPHHIIFDRVIVSGEPTLGGRRGFMLNGRILAVINSYVNGWREKGADSQAIAGWNGAEGYKIDNNYLEAAGENVAFGGGTSSINGLNPSDMEITRNYFYKPIAWKSDSWIVKNLFELKVGERVLLEGNVLDGSWAGEQGGKAINLKSTTQDPIGYSHTGDITIRYNLFRNIGAFISLVGIYPGPAQPLNNVNITQNIVENINIPPYTGDSFLFLIGASTPNIKNLSITHNTMTTSGPLNAAMSLDPGSATDVEIRDNIFTAGTYGIKAPGKSSGTPSLDSGFSNYSFVNNVLTTATDIASIQSLSSDGTNAGADTALVTKMVAGVSNGRPQPVVVPVVVKSIPVKVIPATPTPVATVSAPSEIIETVAAIPVQNVSPSVVATSAPQVSVVHRIFTWIMNTLKIIFNS
ncbi:MAG: hypothetical protein JWL80_434 [Parcubacteria group bacterium]|nr:hypothetical protein [Parcubacteria group bacterium]